MRLRVAAAARLFVLSAGTLSVALPAHLAAGPSSSDPEKRDRTTDAPAGPSLFDPARHMRLSEVKVGMRGYGLSVFRGTKIERFDVEVLSILRNFNPKCDVVLIDCKGANLEHTGSIAGMSGSPVFLRDDEGRERMIGAFAYGWPLTKDPIAGVQPIEYMLTLPADKPARPPLAGAPSATTAPSAALPTGDARQAGDAPAAEPRGAWSLNDAMVEWDRRVHPPMARGGAAGAPRRIGLAGNDAPRLQPLATPLMASGLPPRVLDQLGPALEAAGVVPMQTGGGGSGAGDEPAAPLEPGSVLAVPILTGDTELTAIGTVTEVIGDRVFGFGHAFNNEGPISLPMGSGKINGIVANLSTSFKLGAMTRARGELLADQTVGVAGRTGDLPATIPVDLDVTDAAGRTRHYHFNLAAHARFTPLVCGVAFASAVGGASELPQYNTVDYGVDIEFANGRTIRVMDTAANTSSMEMFQGVGMAMTAASENPFERVLVKRVSGTIKVAAETRTGQITEVNVPRLKYRPGETVKAFVTYKPFRADEAVMPIEMELPKDLPQGTYQLVVSDADRYFADEQATQPFRFTAERASDVFDVLKEASAVRHNAVYVRLVRKPDGVAVGRTALPQLPSSRRQILLGAGRSNTTPFASSIVRILSTNRVMTGSAEFQIQVETHNKVEGGTVSGPTSRPSVLPTKTDGGKPPKSGPMETPGP